VLEALCFALCIMFSGCPSGSASVRPGVRPVSVLDGISPDFG